MMNRVMLIPTQEERYSKAPRITLLLCVMIPCAVVAWIGGYRDMLTLVFAFLSIRIEDQSVLDFMKRAARYFLLSQQTYFWREEQIGTHRGKEDMTA